MAVALTKPKADREIRFVTLTPFREANGVTIDPLKRTARCIIISEGLGNLRDRNYYTADAIESAAEVFEGKQFYINHPSESEEDDRPERDVRDLAGWFSGTELGYITDPQSKERLRACFANLHFDEAEGGETAMAKVKAALAYQKQFPMSKDVYAGISINGGGVSHPGAIKGMQVNMVTEIQEAFSADIVTKPARGGRFLALVKEAAKAAAWSGSRTRTSRESLPRMGAEGGRYMATATVNKKPKDKPVKEATADEKEAKAKEQRKLRFHATNLMLEVKSLKRQAKEADAQDTLDTFKEVASEKLKTAGAKFKKMKANADVAGGELADLLLDIQQDIGELSKMIGMGGGEEVPEEVPEGEDEQDTMVPSGSMTDETEDEEEKEAKGKTAEGEDEQESEDEQETKAAEGEDEQEAEDEKAAESEDEEESGEEESEDEEEALPGEDEDDEDYGMGDEEEEAGQAMKFKCGKCGEVNNVATPKGYKLVAAEAKMGESERGMQGFITKLQRQLEAKEGRFVKTNHRLAKVLKENFKLRAKVTAYDRMDEAAKLLKESNIPADILPVKDLVTLYEPEQWGAAIRNAKRMLEREQKLLGKAPRLKEGGGDGKDDEKDDSLIATFTESYKGK